MSRSPFFVTQPGPGESSRHGATVSVAPVLRVALLLQLSSWKLLLAVGDRSLMRCKFSKLISVQITSRDAITTLHTVYVAMIYLFY